MVNVGSSVCPNYRVARAMLELTTPDNDTYLRGLGDTLFLPLVQETQQRSPVQ
jgi:hypothetical protein